MDTHTHQAMHTLALTLSNIHTFIHTRTLSSHSHTGQWALTQLPCWASPSTCLHMGEGWELSSSALRPVKPSMASPQPDQEQDSKQFLRPQIHVPKQTELETLPKKYRWEKVLYLHVIYSHTKIAGPCGHPSGTLKGI